MRAAVQLENAVVEVLDPQADSRHAEAQDDGELGVGERTRLALERHFLGALPGRDRLQPLDEALELLRREERRGAAAEVHEIEVAARDGRLLSVELPFAREHIEVL